MMRSDKLPEAGGDRSNIARPEQPPPSKIAHEVSRCRTTKVPSTPNQRASQASRWKKEGGIIRRSGGDHASAANSAISHHAAAGRSGSPAPRRNIRQQHHARPPADSHRGRPKPNRRSGWRARHAKEAISARRSAHLQYRHKMPHHRRVPYRDPRCRFAAGVGYARRDARIDRGRRRYAGAGLTLQLRKADRGRKRPVRRRKHGRALFDAGVSPASPWPTSR